MRVVIQRVSSADLNIEEKLKCTIGKGMLVLLGIEVDDNETDIDWLTKKIISLRIFNDEDYKMNLSIKDVEGDFMVVSQFTLHASTKKGNRPSYIKSARPEHAEPLYHKFNEQLTLLHGKQVFTGIFGADMKVSLINDGPVTIIIDSKQKA